jgi:xanthine/uracil/vitamin C permease (AzgA family)
MLDSIPLNLRIAMGSGVGLFIGFIGLKAAVLSFLTMLLFLVLEIS